MNVSPLDLRKQRFRSTFRGFDKVEVSSFLTAAAEDYEQALKETDRLRQDMLLLEASLDEYRKHEKNLQATLLTAQKLADDLKAGAEEESKRILQDAQSRSEFLQEQAQGRLEEVEREIDNLKLKRRQIEISIEGLVQVLRHTLDYVRNQDEQERQIFFNRTPVNAAAVPTTTRLAGLQEAKF
jgi:cell division initiation protein